jgi:CheY-like chemotaxis protein
VSPHLSEHKASFRIFIVDDEQTIAKTTSLILQKEGFEAVPFTDPELLLEFSRECPPNLVISDIIMPQMNGFELATALRKALPDCRIILLTGHADASDLRDLALEQGHELEVLSKPLHPTKLIACVRK